MRYTSGAIALCLFLCDVQCNLHDLKLRIYRVIDGSYSQLPIGVEEQIGQNLALSCDLSSADHAAYDDQLIWAKATEEFNFKNETDLELLAKKKSPQLFALLASTPTQHVNRALKTFGPLKEEDTGTYFCGSLKYIKFKVIYVIVREANGETLGGSWVNINRNAKKTNWYCNERMFKCKSSDACINPHYLCDKKPDCADGSDESKETCKGDPCVGKLKCDDGRCIPTSWCCDRHHDLDCNVTYRPSCCQLLSDTYDNDQEEYFVPYNMTQPVRANGNRYIFITLCILATFFSMLLMLLILSKIFLLAKKTRCREHRIEQMLHLEECAHRNFRARVVYSLDATGGGANDALLVLSDDILRTGGGDSGRMEPPSYTDVINLEPPPPYTSQDCLNRT